MVLEDKIIGFAGEAMTLLSCTDLSDPAHIVQVFSEFYLPIMRRHLVGYEITGAATNSTIAGNASNMHITAQHLDAYLAKLTETLGKFKNTVEQNKITSKYYVTPRLELDAAKEMASESFEEAFRIARESYRRRDKDGA
jgi:hypothetical protein